MTLQWREQFSVGNDLIDSDHQYLLEIINKAQASLQANQLGSLLAVLDELAHYGKSHFEREEQVAKAVGYPKADQLHESHALLTTELEKFCHAIGQTWTAQESAEFTTFLRNWLINHVIKEDMLLKPWLTKHSPRFDPR